MTNLIVVAGTVGLVLLGGLIVTIYWLSKARKAQVEAELISDSLIAAKRGQHAIKEIMEEPVAFEPAWLERERKRLRNNDRDDG